METNMTRLLLFIMVVMVVSTPAQAFCGFYVAKADADLFNDASKVVLARHENRTVITMANNYKGDVSEFAIVIPVPTLIKMSQVNIADSKVIDHLDAYSAPRLVEYYDSDPCQAMMRREMMMAPSMAVMEDAAGVKSSAESLGVTIEDSYTVGEYDILILSAKQSDGLLKWLNQEGYKLPEGAESVLKSYIKQDMKFFVAKVNLEEFDKSGYTYLRPISVAYESEKFMLPIRLGTLNASGPQDLILMTITKNGRVEPVNYRTVKIPTGDELPLFIADEFGSFYKDMFKRQAEKEDYKAVFLEYAWDMAWCDPCAADPVPAGDLRRLGAWWIEQVQPPPQRPVPIPMNGTPANGTPAAAPMIAPAPPPVNAFITRMHIRYTADSFPEDLVLQTTDDRENFQGRYVLRHPWTGEASCEAASEYYKNLPAQFDRQAKTLAHLTGWPIDEIRQKMNAKGQPFDIKPFSDGRPWWEQIWKEEAE